MSKARDRILEYINTHEEPPGGYNANEIARNVGVTRPRVCQLAGPLGIRLGDQRPQAGARRRAETDQRIAQAGGLNAPDLGTKTGLSDDTLRTRRRNAGIAGRKFQRSIREAFEERIRQLREAKPGITQQQLAEQLRAEQLSTSQSAISRVEIKTGQGRGRRSRKPKAQ